MKEEATPENIEKAKDEIATQEKNVADASK